MLNIDLSGRVALVTGATGELGRAMVRTLARAGADVGVHYQNNTKMAHRLREELGELEVRATTIQADVTRKDEVFGMRDALAEALGPADIIVNNAVIQYEWTSVLKQSAEDYETQFRSSVLQNVYMAQAFVPSMVERGWGRVIGINTECSMQCWEQQSAYISGKRGMDGVLRVLAREVGNSGVTVNQVAPGWTLSENRPEGKTPSEAAYREKVPLRRRGKAREIADVVTFIASDLAAYVSGAFIPVCGGNVMPAI